MLSRASYREHKSFCTHGCFVSRRYVHTFGRFGTQHSGRNIHRYETTGFPCRLHINSNWLDELVVFPYFWFTRVITLVCFGFYCSLDFRPMPNHSGHANHIFIFILYIWNLNISYTFLESIWLSCFVGAPSWLDSLVVRGLHRYRMGSNPVQTWIFFWSGFIF